MSIADSYSRLKAFRDNFPDKSSFGVVEDYVHEYHDIVNDLEADTGMSLLKYRVPNEALKPRVTQANMFTGEKKYSSDRYCKTELFKMKVDALLNRFTFSLDNQSEQVEDEYQIGFKKKDA